MFRRSFELTHADLGAHLDERREGVPNRPEERRESVPRFKRSEVTSSDHFEKRKLGRIVSKLSLIDRLEILEELDDDGEEDTEDIMIQRKVRNLDRQDSGLSTVSNVSVNDSETDSVELVSTRKVINSTNRRGDKVGSILNSDTGYHIK